MRKGRHFFVLCPDIMVKLYSMSKKRKPPPGPGWGARWRLCISLWRLFECVKVRVTLNQENGWAHLPKPCFQLDGPAISKIKLLRLVFAYFSLYTQKHRTFVRCFCCVFFVNTFWRCHPDLNWGVELLQSSALPLGYGTRRSGMLQKNWSE